jgi:hypothetical protein
MRMRSISALALVLAVCVGAPIQAQSTETAWERIDEDEGITTWKHEVPGQLVPGFRGQVIISSDIETVRLAIEDVKSHTKWMHRCAESTMLKPLSEVESLVYNRTDSPWPVSDRDVVLKTKRVVNGEGDEVLLAFQNTKSELKPEQDGVVRMPKLVGFYKLAKLKDGRTKVTYQVEADVGGSLPDWIVKHVVKEMPFETLSKLRDRVSKKK